MYLTKVTIVAFISAIFLYLEPINQFIKALIIVFLLDICTATAVDLFKNKDQIRIKNFLFPLICIALYSVIIVSVFVIGKQMEDESECLKISKTITYICIYFYSRNILKNLTLLFPHNKIFAFLYKFLGLQIAKRLPGQTYLFKKVKDKKEK